jgi:hypothetical protein
MKEYKIAEPFYEMRFVIRRVKIPKQNQELLRARTARA